jgi:putative tryptophan/tyrosine transport system substrate-binding protein
VFEVGFDPVEVGLLASLNRPGGNLTGVTNSGVEVAAKQPKPLHELVAAATRFALLVNPSNPMLTERMLRDTQVTVAKLGLQLDVPNARAERDLDGVFATLTQLRAGALVIGAVALFIEESRQLAALTIRHAITASFHFREIRRGRRPCRIGSARC